MSNPGSQFEETFLNGRVKVVTGDITKQSVVAIVNAANSTLLGGGGVDGAIHRAGGPSILRECQQLRATKYPKGLPTGDAVITTGGNLPSKYVIHTVGPIYSRDADSAGLLAACYENSLRLAQHYEVPSVAFPAISTGAFGYPAQEAAAVSSSAIQEFLMENELPLAVLLVFFQDRDARVFSRYHKFE